MTQFEDYKRTEMTWDDEQKQFTGVIPGDFIVSKWQLMYFMEAADRKGRGIRLPDLEIERPYVIVPVKH
jgi:hypothetical protein